MSRELPGFCAFSGRRTGEDGVRRPPAALGDGDCGEPQPNLGALASELAGLLVPVSPPPTFRDVLARELAAVAQHKKAPEIVLQRPPGHRRGLLIGAMVSSAVSVAGLIALLWHRHSHQATRRAS
ncbi:MAG: hypothetical protein QME94_06455 [Anaerolineae bacterium]|nr:hypothetical protein [Anaerolineae bacterium]